MGFYRNCVVPHLINFAMRNGRLVPYRERVLALARGRVLEIGMGSGMNLPLYRDGGTGTKVIGLDPEPRLLTMALSKHTGVPLQIIEASAESIPLKDVSIDTVVCTWSLCSIPDVVSCLREVHRVLKPDGQFLFVEHGLAPDASVRRWQHRLTPMWKRFAGGCHLDRPVRELIENAGFQIVQFSAAYMPGPKPMTFMYEGSARPN